MAVTILPYKHKILHHVVILTKKNTFWYIKKGNITWQIETSIICKIIYWIIVQESETLAKLCFPLEDLIDAIINGAYGKWCREDPIVQFQL